QTHSPTLCPLDIGTRSASTFLVSSREHACFLDKPDAKSACSALTARYEQSGPISQIGLLGQAFSLKYRPAALRLEETNAQMKEITHKIFAMGIPDENAFLI